ncbi:cation:proton antiporter [uncultured Roseobacter sp.]|uniref:cation:proton antiporter domain-containing protein n=1 Tax=uncultured Roseobacter sp. TaxID=114847 RepID=UPI00262181C8|nr:cation:proton antiporter [uncultured Roseobacter sp.]
MLGFFIVCILSAAFTMVAHRMASTIVTPPMVFLLIGALLAAGGLTDPHLAESLLHPVAEITLVVLLFLDASQIDLRAFRHQHIWPTRMLLIGLPMAVALGTLAGMLLMPAWPFFAAALAAAILAPTDAALGQAVVSNPDVPDRARRALTVESGLNDGLALPAVLFFASMLAASESADATNWLAFGAGQILLGPLAGAAIGAAGGSVLLLAKKYKTTSELYEGVGALALAGAAYLGASLIGGNGFISAFAAGLAFGAIVRGACAFVYEFTESEGQLLAWSAFLLLGAAVVPEAVAHLTLPMFALIMVSLFVVRPLAIWVSLLGTDATATTRIFFGWFGPRGLATALFALLVVDQIAHDFAEPILHLAVNAVWISALLHGVTAAPAARWYGAKEAGMAPIGCSAKPLVTRMDTARPAEPSPDGQGE